MRKLFIILIIFLAVVTFIRAFDNAESVNLGISSDISGDSRMLTD